MRKKERKVVIRLSRVDLERLQRGEIENAQAAVREPEPRFTEQAARVGEDAGGDRRTGGSRGASGRRATTSDADYDRDPSQRSKDAWLTENVPPHW